MRTALIRGEFITHLDGVNRFISNLAEGFRFLGHDVVIAIVTERAGGAKPKAVARW